MKHRKNRFTALGLTVLSLCTAGACLTSCAEKPVKSSVSAPIIAAEADESIKAPVFSAESGFYDNDLELTITAGKGMTIYYTLDGSDPVSSGTKYEGAVSLSDRSSEPDILSANTDVAVQANPPGTPVDKAVVVRAAAVDSKGAHSPIAVGTYFIGFNRKKAYYRDTRIISLTVDEADLFDYDRGIFVLGSTYDKWKNSDEYDYATPEWSIPANYTMRGRDWEREAAMQIFEGGSLKLTQNVGIRVHGGATRSYAQKSMNVYARTVYGAPKLEYDLFSGRVRNDTDKLPVTEFDSFILRNGGNDAFFTRFRDKLAQELVADRDFLKQGMEPCIVFINGEFWGHYEITEKTDAACIKEHFGVPKKNVCIIKKEALDEGTEEGFAEFQELRDWIRSTDFSNGKAYEELCSKVDMKGFMEYVSAEIYINNSNWGKSNMAVWKAMEPDAALPYADGRWRFIMYDADYSSGIYGEVLPEDDSFGALMDSDCFLADLFNGALKNEDFRQQFRSTFREMAEKDFGSKRVDSRIDELSDEYRYMTVDTFERFWSSWTADAEWIYNEEVERLRSFYDKRCDSIMKYLDLHIPASEKKDTE